MALNLSTLANRAVDSIGYACAAILFVAVIGWLPAGMIGAALEFAGTPEGPAMAIGFAAVAVWGFVKAPAALEGLL
jgi:hypothetical protein